MKTFIQSKQPRWQRKERAYIKKLKAKGNGISATIGSYRKAQLNAYNPLENAMAKILDDLHISYIRQSIIGSYIVDFLVDKIIIETDGSCHIGREEEDRIRDLQLSNKGYKVIHFTSKQVFQTPKAVSATLASLLV